MSMPPLDGQLWRGPSLPEHLLEGGSSNTPTASPTSPTTATGFYCRNNSKEQLRNGNGDNGDSNGEGLKKNLQSRHITMIAIGGAVGTGLIIGTGQALARAGPGSVLIAYTAIGFLVYLVMCAVGEMASWLPLSSGFTGYAVRFCDPALGFALGWTYWFKYIIGTPNNLTAIALVLQYWIPAERINPGVWITLFLFVIIFVNYFGVKIFGELQYWLSTTKILVFLGLMVLSVVLAAGGGPNHHATGFQYWNHPGAFRPYLDYKNETFGKFLGVWSSMINAVFAYIGTELVGVTVGEAENPRKTIPSAIRTTFWRILFFYVVSVFLVGLLVPYDSEALAFAIAAGKDGGSASASPFVVAIELAGIKILPGFINGCIVLFIVSGATSELYIATRTIYGLALEKSAPAFLKKTNKAGTPVYALAISSAFCLLAYMSVSSDSKEVFAYFVSMVSMFGLLTWISILVVHISFIRGLRTQKIPRDWLPFRAPFGLWGSIGALVFCILIAVTKHFHVFVCDNDSTGTCFEWRHFITGYIGIPLYLGMIAGHKIIMGSKGIKPRDMDFYSGKEKVDAEEAEFLAKAAEERTAHGRRHWFYRRVVGLLF